jgi:hypothetical protein
MPPILVADQPSSIGETVLSRDYVANCLPSDHKPRGDRARKDYGKMSDFHLQ